MAWLDGWLIAGPPPRQGPAFLLTSSIYIRRLHTGLVQEKYWSPESEDTVVIRHSGDRSPARLQATTAAKFLSLPAPSKRVSLGIWPKEPEDFVTLIPMLVRREGPSYGGARTGEIDRLVTGIRCAPWKFQFGLWRSSPAVVMFFREGTIDRWLPGMDVHVDGWLSWRSGSRPRPGLPFPAHQSSLLKAPPETANAGTWLMAADETHSAGTISNTMPTTGLGSR